MRILYVTTIGITMSFFKSLVKELIDLGNTVDIATNDSEYNVEECYNKWGCNIHTLFFSRSPFDLKNIGAFFKLQKIVENGRYDIVHCHTPIASVCTRLACRKLRKKGVRVVYTAHGFHFYNGASYKNWALFYPIEKMCSRFTDVLITINKEDYSLALKKMKAGLVVFVPGVGVNLEKFSHMIVDKVQKRRELGIPEDAFLLLSVGELNENKNHCVLVKMLELSKETNIHCMIAGTGKLHERLVLIAKSLGVCDRLHLLGFRKDVPELLKAADVYVHCSQREGLPVSVIEAMASGVPCVVSKIRGCSDLINNGENGFLFDSNDIVALNKIILNLYNNPELMIRLSQNALIDSRKYDNKVINNTIINIYKNVVYGMAE